MQRLKLEDRERQILNEQCQRVPAPWRSRSGKEKLGRAFREKKEGARKSLPWLQRAALLRSTGIP